MQYRKRKIPEINSSSSADIAFLLLIFFLITSSLDSKTGIYRRLSPSNSTEALKKKMDIQERNLLSFSIDNNNLLSINTEPITLSEIKEIAKTFISNPDDVDFLPDKELIEIPEIGEFAVATKHIIELKVSRNANFQTYISVQNELTAAYNELRNELAQKIFHSSFDRLSEDQKTAIREAYPLRISESEIPLSEEEGGNL